jgi:hypothetical protein
MLDILDVVRLVQIGHVADVGVCRPREHQGAAPTPRNTKSGDKEGIVMRRMRDPYDEEAHPGLVAITAAAGHHGQARRYYRSYVAKMDDSFEIRGAK